MLNSYLRIQNVKNIYTVLRKCASTSSCTEKWDIFTSVCLERKPIITPLLNELENEFQKYLTQVELERSLKSNHEIKHEKDKKHAEMLKQASQEVDLDAASVQTAQDFEDACMEELSKFKFARRDTESDAKNDTKSMNRKLDKHLVLLMEQKIGSKQFFLPPQGNRKEGETLRQTAQRILEEYCGKNMKTQIYGNAPIGFYKYKYPKNVQQKNGVTGVKVFIYFARYLNGDVVNKGQYKWLDRNELAKEMPEEYYKSISKFLIDDTTAADQKTMKKAMAT